MGKRPVRCEWTPLQDALTVFAENVAGHQGQSHIKPLHWYTACRFVIEGGFLPEDITPRPPFIATKRRSRWILEHDPKASGSGERAVLGGLKTKNVDVVVCKDGVGPVVAVSTKGTLNAFRNLTNRMEEAVGDCTNLHIAYPALVYGFLHVLRANVEREGVPPNDVVIRRDGTVSEAIIRYHDVVARLSDRDDVRAEVSKYEAVAMALVAPNRADFGTVIDAFPPSDSPLRLEIFFDKLYTSYDLRFVFAAPSLESTTRRVEWDPESPVLADSRVHEFNPRVSH